MTQQKKEEKPKSAEEMTLYAWVGADDAHNGDGEFGIKQAVCPAGTIPMVACKESKVSQSLIASQMKVWAEVTGIPRQLVRFKFDRVLMTVTG